MAGGAWLVAEATTTVSAASCESLGGGPSGESVGSTLSTGLGVVVVVEVVVVVVVVVDVDVVEAAGGRGNVAAAAAARVPPSPVWTAALREAKCADRPTGATVGCDGGALNGSRAIKIGLLLVRATVAVVCCAIGVVGGGCCELSTTRTVAAIRVLVRSPAACVAGGAGATVSCFSSTSFFSSRKFAPADWTRCGACDGLVFNSSS